MRLRTRFRPSSILLEWHRAQSYSRWCFVVHCKQQHTVSEREFARLWGASFYTISMFAVLISA